MAIKYNSYGSPQIYGSPQVQSGKDRKYQRAFMAQQAANKAAMDLLLKGYNTNIEKNRVVTATREVGMKNDIYDSFFADTTNTKIIRRATTGNDLLLGAKTAEELLQVAGVVKPTGKGKPLTEYNKQMTAAKGLIGEATAANRLGGNIMFDLNDPYANAISAANSPWASKATKAAGKKAEADQKAALVPTTYSFDRMAGGISDALTKKYAALGGLQRGALKNESATTADDEGVIFNTSAAFSVEQDFAAMSKNFAATTAEQNAAFTSYGQDQKKIGMYQTASLSEDQMYKKILSDIEGSYTSFNNIQESRNVSDTYVGAQDLNKTTTSATQYLGALPTTIKK